MTVDVKSDSYVAWQRGQAERDLAHITGADVSPDSADATLVNIASVGVIGGGQMGNGIAHVCALAGLPVVLLDVKAEALTKAMATMARNMERQVNRSIISSDDRDAALARVTTSTDYEAFGDADLVIEAATEKEDVKRAI